MGAAAGVLEPLSLELVLAGVVLAVPLLSPVAPPSLLLTAGLFDVDE